MKRNLFKLFTLIFIVFPLNLMSANEEEYKLAVDTTTQTYTYRELMDDIELLAKAHPNLIRYQLTEKTSQGRQIPLVFFGDTLAKKKIMITASIHGREYRSSHLVMAMLERYLHDYDTGTFKEKKYGEIFDSTLFVIVPMVNPDGVEIAQKGMEGCVTDDAKQMVEKHTEKGIHYDQIKANARGVDINYNFRNCFGKSKWKRDTCGYFFYAGTKPYSEVEARLLRSVAEKWRPDCFLNYHTSGNAIFYGCTNALPSVNTAARRIANMINKQTGFVIVDLQYAKSAGTWADEVEYYYRKPSVTIESGSKNPVPIEEFNDIFEKNKDVWLDLVLLLDKPALKAIATTTKKTYRTTRNTYRTTKRTYRAKRKTYRSKRKK